ncbi:MAG: YfcC family protein [Bacillota bacterium]
MSKERRAKWPKINIPHVFAIIFAIIIIVSIFTWIIPAGEYQRVTTPAGQTVAVQGTYHAVQSAPAMIMDVLSAPAKGFKSGGEIIGFLIITGGVFGIINRTGAINSGILRAVKLFAGKEIVIIPIFMVLFSIGGAVFGMAEETIPFVGIFVPLCLAMGYDSIVGMAIPLVGAMVGFSSAMLNPFTVGIAQSFAEIPLFSGMQYRIVLWVIFTTITIIYIMFYARRIKRNPTLSPTYRHDCERRLTIVAEDKHHHNMTIGQKLVLLTLFAAITAMVIGVTTAAWFIPEIAGIFIAMGIFSGIFGRLSANEMANSFLHGAKDLLGACIVVGLARGILIIANDGKIIDTALYYLSEPLLKLPLLLSVNGMFLVQHLINFFVPSGTGQAALTIPIMAPLGDILGISRQTTVLIYQFGNGFVDMLWPTSAPLVGALGMAKLDWGVWAKWIIPLQVIYLFVCSIALCVAVLIGY